MKTSSEIFVAPEIGGSGMVIVRTGDNQLAAYDAKDGKRKWFFQRPTPALSLRVSARSVIDGKYVLRASRWQADCRPTSNGAAVWDGTVAVPKGATELDRVADITSAGHLGAFRFVRSRSRDALPVSTSVAAISCGRATCRGAWTRYRRSRFLYVSDDKGAVMRSTWRVVQYQETGQALFCAG